MKKALIFIALVCFFLSGRALADELIVHMEWLEDIEGLEVSRGRKWITRLDTDTGEMERIFSTRLLGYELDTIATAPDGSIYFSVTDGVYDDSGISLGYAYRIWKITPSRTPEGDIEYGDETMVYEVFHGHDGSSTDDRIAYLRDLAIRYNPGTGANRVYFSVSCGACDDGHIYYVDDVPDFGAAVEYYTVFLDSIEMPSCGAGGAWAGHFAFDESDNLFLSNGNSIPSALHQVSGAGLDSVDPGATPEFIYERAGSLLHLLCREAGRIDFLPWEPNIMYLTGEPPGEDMLFSDPAVQYIGEIALWPTEALRDLPLPPWREPWKMRTPSRLFRPDLTIADFEILPARSGTGGPNAEIPVRVEIKNSGRGISTSFKVGFTALYPGQTKPVPVPFNVPGLSGQKSGWIKLMRAGGEIYLVGFLKIKPPSGTKASRQEIAITAIVDSCLGDLEMPKYCRVEESNETNNHMTIKFKRPIK